MFIIFPNIKVKLSENVIVKLSVYFNEIASLDSYGILRFRFLPERILFGYKSQSFETRNVILKESAYFALIGLLQ
jgi:hypothetical protein